MIEKYFDINEGGHSIRCKEYYKKDLHTVTYWIVASYGFGGNKDNKTIEKFAERITSKYKGYGVICFDWPGHGKDGRSRMVISECLEYLDQVNRFVIRERNAKKLYNFSASMGAYFTLLYIHRLREQGEENPYEKIALRCPAIDFYHAIFNQMSEQEKEKLAKKKEIELGYDRRVLITEDFLQDLQKNDLTKYEFFDDAERIILLHGTKDNVVPIEDTAAFADANVIDLIPVENADHPFSNPGSMDFAIQKVITFFAP